MKMQAAKMERNEKIIKMYMKGYSYNMIESVLNLKRGVVCGVIKYYVKDRKDRQPVKYVMPRIRKRSKEQEEKTRIAKEMRSQGFKYREIGEALHVGWQRARQLVNNYN